jgi:TolB-like protein
MESIDRMMSPARFVGTVRKEEVNAILGSDVGSQPSTSFLALPDKPSIAVLAFTNMSGDPTQDYFSDGITEDIITELSRFAELMVIARNSSFQYKGKSIDARQVGRELGVRYVLEGSIRRTGDRACISAQLVDAVTGVHRWAERYDRKLKDLFAVQDDVARTIVSVLAVHVNKAETERVLATPPMTWQAYEHYLQAADTLVSYHSSLNKADLLQGRRGLSRVLAIDQTTHELMQHFQRPMCPCGFKGGTTTVPGLQPSTAPTSPPARRCGWPPICPRLMLHLVGL